jgi:hypothetical protein
MIRRVPLWMACAAAGCATASPRQQTLRYTDHQYFAIEQSGGHISGKVCSVGVDFTAQARPDGVALQGNAEQRVPMSLEVHDTAGGAERALTGPNIDLKLTHERVSGKVGSRVYDLPARGDEYVGTLQIDETQIPFAIRGKKQLWSMSATAQATILPLLLTCSTGEKIIQVIDLRGTETSSPGEAGYRPPEAPSPQGPRPPSGAKHENGRQIPR